MHEHFIDFSVFFSVHPPFAQTDQEKLLCEGGAPSAAQFFQASDVRDVARERKENVR